MIDNTHIDKLKEQVGIAAGFSISTSRDFEKLHELMQHRISEAVGVSTLKRLWGYIDGYKSVRDSTLDVLSRFVGFPDWQTFVADQCGVDDMQTSHRIITSTLDSSEVAEGACVALEWNPNRRLVIKHLGSGRYEVVEACNTKLDVGDTFCCDRFMMCQPLYVYECHHADMPAAPFVMGKKGGLTKVKIQ